MTALLRAVACEQPGRSHRWWPECAMLHFERITSPVTSQSKRESRKVLVAVLASLFVHVVIALSVAAFSGSSASLPQMEDQPVQLTMVDLPAPPAPRPPANPAYMETDAARETAEQPKDKTFESN